MKKILLIDDEEINLFILQNLLRLSQINAEILFYNTSKKAIEYLKTLITEQKGFPDLILLDIEMPVMNGWDFLDDYRKLDKSYQKDCKIIIFTTSIIEQDILKAQSYKEVQDLLNKPMTVEMIKNIEQAYLVK